MIASLASFNTFFQLNFVSLKAKAAERENLLYHNSKTMKIESFPRPKKKKWIL